MQVFETIMCAFLILFAVFLVVAVLMQQGKDHGLSGTIAGGADTFFGKTKAAKWDKVLGRLTTIVSIVFVVIVLVVYIIQPDVVYTQSGSETVPGGISPYYNSDIINPTEPATTTEANTETNTANE